MIRGAPSTLHTLPININVLTILSRPSNLTKLLTYDNNMYYNSLKYNESNIMLSVVCPSDKCFIKYIQVYKSSSFIQSLASNFLINFVLVCYLWYTENFKYITFIMKQSFGLIKYIIMFALKNTLVINCLNKWYYFNVEK